MYSDNIGLYYDLENLMKVIKQVKPGTKTAYGREVAFAFVGSGTVLDKLVAYKIVLQTYVGTYIRKLTLFDRQM